ncbi:hypothetical protein PSPO01_09855 [Paraphaeosphaeria sporulosa]
MSSANTDSTIDSIVFEMRQHHALRSRLYTSPRLPTYQTFLDQLRDLDTGSLTPGAYCPICRVPFSESQTISSNAGSEYQYGLALETLPFHIEDSHALIDSPVRLPCASQHIVGKACIVTWATEGGGTTCPLDREELFILGAEDTFSVTDDEHRFNTGLRAIEKLPIRQLLVRFRAATESGIVRVNARAMTKRLATLIFRIVFETHGVPEAATLRWKWPRIGRPLYGYNEASAFRSVVKQWVDGEPLEEDGGYPRHIVTLLNPALPHVFALLYRLARFFQARSMSLDELACAMQQHMHVFFKDFAYVVTDEKVLRSITFKTIDIWTTQELLVTQLRTATNQPDEWAGIVGPRDRPVTPYFGLRGRGRIGYWHFNRESERERRERRATLGEAAGLLVYDDDEDVPQGESGRERPGVSRSPDLGASVRPWSPLNGETEEEFTLLTSGIIINDRRNPRGLREEA